MALLKNRKEALEAYRYLRTGPNVPAKLSYWLVVSVYALLHSDKVMAQQIASEMDATLANKVHFYGII